MIDLRHPLNVCRASAGTGKTYTLAAYYVGLLLSGEDYRSILAVTFTNKATSEMSERIIGYLYGISQGQERAFLLRAREFMIRHQDASDEQLQQRAGECFRAMLMDFDNVHICTIDAFLQSLLTGLAGVLRMSTGLTTELDIDHVIRKAVEQLLTTRMTDADRAILEDYMQLKLDEQSHWDVRQSLCSMAKELYNESVQMLDADGRILFDAPSIEQRRKALEQRWKEDPQLAELKALLARCNPENYNRYTTTAYERLKQSVEDPAQLNTKDRFRGVSEKSCNADEMAQATELAARVARTYNTIQLTIRFSRDMELMASLRNLIQTNLAEANCALLAQTASTLSKALHEGDADFILEKAGIRYHHVLMDEFQDTSRLQWTVINRLLQDLLAGEGHTLLIVGDIKQSIYRWRNGDWSIMASLGADETHYGNAINRAFPNLVRNFRSSEQVVKFNLSLFDHIIASYPHEAEKELISSIYGEGFTPQTLAQFYQADKKPGGYVRFRAIRKATKEDLAFEMFDAIEDLLAKGAKPDDIMILVREKKEAALICDLHATITNNQSPITYLKNDQSPITNYQYVRDVHLVSADSFLLEASEAVRTIIAALKVLVLDDPVAAQFVAMVTGEPDSITRLRQAVSDKTPLYEAVCEVIKILLCDPNGQYKGSETAYVMSILDYTRGFVSVYGSNIKDFLTYWDDTLHAKPIPASSTDAIRILTVHASKGLQAQTLFVPFCMWTKEAGKHPQKVWCHVPQNLNAGDDYIPVQDGSEMFESDYHAEYEAEHMNMRIDNLNMLYVALTRAEDNLFVYTSYPVTAKGVMGTCNHVGRYIMDFVGADEYEQGEPLVKQREDAPGEQSRTMNAELWANDSQVRFIQSQEGALYTDLGDEAYRRVARMDFGNLCHEIFAHVRKADELDRVLDSFRSRGEIASEEQYNDIRTLISSAWEGNEQMRDWFTAPWMLKLEEAIYIDHRELRPDRVMINPVTNEAVVLDYKFGHWEDKYKVQVSEYMEALRRMGYSPVRGYLWFAQKNKLVEVNCKL